MLESRHMPTSLVRFFTPHFALDYARRVRRTFRNFLFKPRLVSHLYGRDRLTVHIEDRTAAEWYDKDWSESESSELALLEKGKLNSGALVFDLGCHQAVVAMMLAKRCARVVAVEAESRSVAVAKKNLVLNHIANVEVLHVAVAGASGMLNFSGESVQAVTVDELAASHGIPSVVFIDIEGAECEALKGATKTLESRPDLFIESHVGVGLEELGGSIEKLLSLIPSGYEIRVSRPYSTEFVPLDLAGDILKKRFFMICQSKE